MTGEWSYRFEEDGSSDGDTAAYVVFDPQGVRTFAVDVGFFVRYDSKRTVSDDWVVRHSENQQAEAMARAVFARMNT